MRRISILEMMGGVGLFAIGLTALRNADEFWQSIVVTLTMGVFGVAILGVWQLRDAERAWWSGFVVFGLGYLTLTVGPWFDTNVGPITATSYLLRSIRDAAEPSQTSFYRDLAEWEYRQKSLANWLAARRAETGGQDDSGMVKAITEMEALTTKIANAQSVEPPGPKRVRAMLPGSLHGTEFTQIGHCLFAHLAAWSGAIVSRRMWWRRQAQPSPSPSPSPRIMDSPALDLGSAAI